MAQIAAQVPAQTASPGPEDDNKPYVGPRTFRPDEGRRFFGRDREARDLIARIVSERFTLFYAQSGAGKSSLINTRVVPGLEAEGFEVLPVARVSGHSGAEVDVDNIYVYNLLSSLHQQDNVPAGLATLSIAQFLDNLVCHDGVYYYDPDYTWPADAELKPRVLFIDQFEEIITTNGAYWAEREAFFRQLGEALEADDLLWIALALREDFIANLDPYLHLVNNGVRHRFYMQHLDREAALLAIKRPVENLRPFEEGAAETLVNNLLASRRQGEADEIHLAEFVEPVQLQAVCYQMWEKLQTRPGPTITGRDVEAFADIDTALVSFYEDTVAQTVAATAVPEIDLRHWFNTQLITEAGTRNMVFRGVEDTGGLPTVVADFVKSRFIVREVVRPGGVWYELVHDRFVQPIQESNRAWLQDQPLLQLAQQWKESGRSETRLLTGKQLEEFSTTKWDVLGPLVAEFMEASRSGRQQRDRRQRLYQTAAIATVMVGLLLLAGFLTFTVRQLSTSNAEKDANATRIVESQRDIADRNAILSTREAQLARSVAEGIAANNQLETANQEIAALRLIDVASDYLAQGRLDAAILLSDKAFQDNPSPRVRSVLFDAMNRKIEQSNLESPLRGNYTLPVDARGETIIPENLMAGPVEGSLAAIDGGRIVWWPMTSGEAPIAQPFLLPLEDGRNILDAAFSPNHNLLATSTGEEMRLWWIENGVVVQSQVIPTAGDVSALTFSQDGLRLAAAQNCISAEGCAQSLISIWDVVADPNSSEPLQEVRAIAGESRIVDLAFMDESGSRLAWTDSYRVLFEGAENDGRETLTRLSNRAMGIDSLAVAPAGNLLIVSGCDKTASETPAQTTDPELPGTPMPTATPAPTATSGPGAQVVAAGPVECDAEDAAWLELWFMDQVNPFGSRMPGPLLNPTFLPDRDAFLFVRQDVAGAESLPYWAANLAAWQSNACAVAGRNLSAGEWIDLNPDRPLEEYSSNCDDFPIHPSVPDVFLRQCREQSDEEDAELCWSALGEFVDADPPLDPADIQVVNDKIAAARDSFSLQRRTTSIGELAEAESLLQGLPEAIAVILEQEILAAYGDICTDEIETDSPTWLEACAHATDLSLGTNYAETNAQAGWKLWRFEGEAGEFVTAVIEDLEGGDANLILYNERFEAVAYNDNFSGFNPHLSHLLTEGGEYTIAVEWRGDAGAYTLKTTRDTPRPLPIGERVSVSETGTRLWRFEGRAGELVSINLEAAEGTDPWLRLRDAEFYELWFNDNFTDLDLIPQIDFYLPYDGSYTVEVGWNGLPGAYSLAAERPEPEQFEPGETIEDVDSAQRLWQFEGRAGDYLTVAVETLDADPKLRLIDPNGVEVGYSDDFDGLDPRLEVLLLQDGPYTVEVSWINEPVDYTLATSRAEAEEAAFGASIEAGPEQRLWRFEGEANDTVTIAARALNGGDSWLKLYDGQFAELAYADTSGEQVNDPRLSYVLRAGDTYFVELGWFGVPDEAELTFESATPGQLGLGETRQSGPEQSVWRLQGEGGELIAVTVETLGPEVALWLRDAENETLAYDEVIGSGGQPQLIYRLPGDEPVFVEVSRPDGLAAPDYTLSATSVEPLPLALGQFVPEAGPDQRLWAFEGQAGALVTFAVQALDGNDPVLTLRNEQFEQIAFSDDTGGSPDPQLTYMLPDDGSYILQVDWFGSSGPYTLSAAAVEPASIPFEVSVTEAGPAIPWAFRGEAGDLVTIDLETQELETQDDAYAWLRLLNARFEEVAFNYEGSGQLNPQISYLLTEDGPYLIEVGWDGTPVPYDLRVSTTVPISLPLDESVPGGEGALSVWAFAGRAGDIISAAVRSLDGGDTYLDLYDGQHNQVAHSDDFNDTDPQLTTVLPADGLYTLEVGWQDWTTVFEEGTLTAPMFGPYELTAATLEPEPLAVGDTIPEAGADRRLWRFEGRAGDTVTIAAEALAGGNPWLRLFDSNFQALAFQDNFDGLNPQLTAELPDDGVYLLEVGWFGEPGTYRLMLE